MSKKASLGAPYILVAEDDFFLNKSYWISFKDQGWEVKFAADGQQAIDAIEKRKPDILLLDLLMPRKDGYAVLEHIKSNGYAIPTIVLTNVSHTNDASKCDEYGVADYIVKSDVDLEDLIRKMKKCIGTDTLSPDS